MTLTQREFQAYTDLSESVDPYEVIKGEILAGRITPDNEEAEAAEMKRQLDGVFDGDCNVSVAELLWYIRAARVLLEESA